MLITENLFPTFQHLKQFQFKLYVEIELNAPKQYTCF